jgi:hypothetical protein
MAGNDDLWQQYAKQIIEIAAPQFDPTKQQLSIASSTLAVDLGNADPAMANNYAFEIGNTIPAAGPAYVPGSGLLTAYRLFLDSVGLGGTPDPNIDAQVNMAAAERAAAQANFSDVQAEAVHAWISFTAIDPNMAFQEYVAEQQPQYSNARNALLQADTRYEQLQTMRYGVAYEVIAEANGETSLDGGAGDLAMPNRFNMPVKSASIAVANAAASLPGQTPEGPASALIPSFAPAFGLDGFSAAYREWQAASAGGARPMSITLDGGSPGSGWTDSGWAIQGESGFGSFLSVWSEVSALQDSQTAFGDTSNYRMQIDFVGMQAFAISPGQWFDLGLLQAFKPKLSPNAPPLFSAGGALARLPAQAVIGFAPTLTLTMAQPDYAAMRTAFEAPGTAAVGLGPFTIGSAHSSTYAGKASAQFKDDSCTIVIPPPPGTLPVLLGVISNRLDIGV